jgi:hypothetical protein
LATRKYRGPRRPVVRLTSSVRGGKATRRRSPTFYRSIAAERWGGPASVRSFRSRVRPACLAVGLLVVSRRGITPAACTVRSNGPRGHRIGRVSRRGDHCGAGGMFGGSRDRQADGTGSRGHQDRSGRRSARHRRHTAIRPLTPCRLCGGARLRARCRVPDHRIDADDADDADVENDVVWVWARPMPIWWSRPLTRKVMVPSTSTRLWRTSGGCEPERRPLQRGSRSRNTPGSRRAANNSGGSARARSTCSLRIFRTELVASDTTSSSDVRCTARALARCKSTRERVVVGSDALPGTHCARRQLGAHPIALDVGS